MQVILWSLGDLFIDPYTTHYIVVPRMATIKTIIGTHPGKLE